MTDDQLGLCLRAFARRRPFRHFLVEFMNGKQIRIRHPEAVGPTAGVWVFHAREGDRVVFASTAVARLLDVPHEANSL